jgi:hypothetical protein
MQAALNGAPSPCMHPESLLKIFLTSNKAAGYLLRHYTRLPLKSISLSRELVIIGLLLIVGLTSSDVWLTSRVFLQRSQIERIVNGEGVSTPFTNTALPTLSGHRLGSDQGYSVYPAGTASLTLLVFRESCPYCEANWKNWDALFADNKLPTSVVLISADQNLSDSYISKHPLLKHQLVILGADPKVLSSLKLTATPQTVYLANGNVKKDWLGVLSSEKLNEIRNIVGQDVN